jgi:hypothetical protein
MRCKLCGDITYGIVKLKCKHNICVSCILNFKNLRCNICNKIFYEELSDNILKRLAENIKSD